MNEKLRRSVPSRVVAFSFILLILLGNYWLVGSITGATPEPWLTWAFIVSALGVGLGACGMAVVAISMHYDGVEPSDDDVPGTDQT